MLPNSIQFTHVLTLWLANMWLVRNYIIWGCLLDPDLPLPSRHLPWNLVFLPVLYNVVWFYSLILFLPILFQIFADASQTIPKAYDWRKQTTPSSFWKTTVRAFSNFIRGSVDEKQNKTNLKVLLNPCKTTHYWRMVR